MLTISLLPRCFREKPVPTFSQIALAPSPAASAGTKSRPRPFFCEQMQRRPVMRAALYSAVALAAASAFVQAPAIGQESDAAQERISRVIVYGRDPCPRG